MRDLVAEYVQIHALALHVAVLVGGTEPERIMDAAQEQSNTTIDDIETVLRRWIASAKKGEQLPFHAA